jgi:FtsP/CotA-like multicopper oxidase with cupredoxin domain
MNSRFGLLPLSAMVVLLLAPAAHAAVPGLKGSSFSLQAKDGYTSQPDGASIYSWGYGCLPVNTDNYMFAPLAISGGFCKDMQQPGPTLIVTEGQAVTITLTNNLPASAGNTSILFPGFQVTTSGGVPGLLTREAAPGGSVTYTLVAASVKPGTRSYYSGTRGDLQVEMGLYGVIIVLPLSPPDACSSGLHAANVQVELAHGELDFRLATAAYDHPQTCYDREYLFQFSEIDPRIHRAAEEQVTAHAGCAAGDVGCSLNVPTEPYVPAYFMINGRSMPDVMDPSYAVQYPHQPYNGNPHAHPGELVLLRVVGQGRWQHPFHEHGSHTRILAVDGNLIVSATDPANNLAGPALFTTSTVPGQATDGIFTWTGKGLNWDPYGHNPASSDANASLPCSPDANGYYTVNSGAPVGAINYYEWCQDHNKPLESSPLGDVAGGGPITLPNPNILANGPWYGGSPYLGPDATIRSAGFTGSTPPSGTIANSPTDEAGFAFIWHSHNERELTTNNIFPGGMFMMALIDSREFKIDESK